MTRVALLERLKQLQQMPKFQKRDITTVSALLSNEALARHGSSARRPRARRTGPAREATDQACGRRWLGKRSTYLSIRPRRSSIRTSRMLALSTPAAVRWHRFF